MCIITDAQVTNGYLDLLVSVHFFLKLKNCVSIIVVIIMETAEWKRLNGSSALCYSSNETRSDRRIS